jgi:uncharacterized membrane protein YcaP (DUF421 family)
VPLHDLSGLIGTTDEITWWQMCVRAVIIFVFGIAVTRVAGSRAFGRHTAFDLILAVLLGSNLSRALTGNAELFSTLAATAVLVVLHTLVGWLALHFDWVGWAAKGRPIQLIRDGSRDLAGMRRALLTERDLAEGLRASGVQDAADVRAAYLERSGEITVVEAPSAAPGPR